MSAAATALGLYLAYLALAFGLRSWLMYRRTGTTGYRGLSGPVGSPGWWGGVLFVVALLAGLAAPVLQLADLTAPLALLDFVPVQFAGVTLAFLGAMATLIAQQAMGKAWRVGVDESESTELVRTGVFALARNPFFTALLITATGLALLAPNPVALSALIVLFAAIELQVRAVEEPYLLASHGKDYRNYAREVGRFLPGIGRHRLG